MSERTLVPIFFFWALLTIITPTLILLSENSKADLDSNACYLLSSGLVIFLFPFSSIFISNFAGNVSEGMKARRMIGYPQNHIITTPTPPAKLLVAEDELASAPAPVPTPSSATSTRTSPRGSHSLHNHTVSSNRTNDGLALSSSKIQAQVK